MHLARLLPGLALLFGALSCGTQAGDSPAVIVVPPPGGKGHRIHEIADPDSSAKAEHGEQVFVSGAVVVAVDDYDETGDGKSSGTIYVADLGSTEPYSGISLYNPSFVPGNLRVVPGDTLDLRGLFQENQDIPIPFAPGAFLVQLSNAIGTFRFESEPPPPLDIDLEDLFDYDVGRQWLNMVVRVKDVTLERGFGSNGRQTFPLAPDLGAPNRCEDPFPKVPALTNDLTDLSGLGLEEGTTIRSLTGVVTFFCNLRIAPRTAADVVL